MVTPDFVGHTFLVHNGKIFQSVFVTANMVGQPLGGEFTPTRFLRNTVRTPAKYEVKMNCRLKITDWQIELVAANPSRFKSES